MATRNTNPPGSDSLVAPAKLRLAKVEEVDTQKYTCKVSFYSNESGASGVVCSGPGASLSYPEWMGRMPRRGDVVLAASPEGAGNWYVIAYTTLATPDRSDDFKDTPENSPRNDFSAGRPPVTEGSQGVYGPSGQMLSVRSDGVVDVFASDLCFRRYSPESNTIEEVFETFRSSGIWGSAGVEVIRNEDDDLAGTTPVHSWSSTRSRTSGHDHIFMDSGFIPGTEKVVLAGAPATEDTRQKSGICLRLLIFDQPTADAYGALGLRPDPGAARLAVLFDKAGNCQTVMAGTLDLSVGDLLVLARGRAKVQSQGGFDITTPENLRYRGGGDVDVEGSKSMRLSTSGNLTLEARRVLHRAVNHRYKVSGPWSINAGGKVEISNAANMVLRAGSDRVDTVGNTLSRHVAGRVETFISGSADPTKAGRDVSNLKTVLKNGKSQSVVQNGSWEVAVGGPTRDTSLALLRISNGLTDPLTRLRFEYWVKATGARISLDSTGAMYAGSPKGAIAIDPSGRVRLGPDVGPVFNVVTSATPCMVTGLPLMGASNVVVALGGPMAPGPGVPVIGALTVPPAPDEPLS